jgi:hypothetical protein
VKATFFFSGFWVGFELRVVFRRALVYLMSTSICGVPAARKEWQSARRRMFVLVEFARLVVPDLDPHSSLFVLLQPVFVSLSLLQSRIVCPFLFNLLVLVQSGSSAYLSLLIQFSVAE